MAQPIKVYVQAVPPSDGNEAQSGASRPEEAQYVPAAEPRKLVEILPAQYETTCPPLIYRLAKVSELSRPEARIGESRVYRAKAFSCGLFYKPISRCLVDWEDR